MDLSQYQTAELMPLLREHLTEYAPNHTALDYEAMFHSGRQRSLRLWNQLIAPDLDIQQQRQFERALADVDMRAGLAIPSVFSFGYVFGAACHKVAGGDLDWSQDAAATSGLYIFIQGLFDHLMDEHPDRFADIGHALPKRICTAGP